MTLQRRLLIDSLLERSILSKKSGLTLLNKQAASLNLSYSRDLTPFFTSDAHLFRHQVDAHLFRHQVAKFGYSAPFNSRYCNGTNEVVSAFKEAIGIDHDDKAKELLLLARNEESVEGFLNDMKLQNHYSACRVHAVAGQEKFKEASFQNPCHAIVDIGLVDSLFHTHAHGAMNQVVKVAHQQLLPGGSFACFSLSRPDFMLQHMLESHSNSIGRKRRRERMWSDMQAWKLPTVLLYRFQKHPIIDN